RELLEAFGVVDLGTERDREHLPAHMLIGVARRQEGKEYLVFPAEVGRDDVGRAFQVVEDGAMVLADSARRSAGAAGVNDAGEFPALDGRDVLPQGFDVALVRG